MSPDLIVRISADWLSPRRAREIALASWSPDLLWVAPGKYRGRGELNIGAHDVLAEDADWNSATWLFTEPGVRRFVSTLERLFELLPGEFEISAAWAGDSALRREPISRDALLELVRSNVLGNRVIYKVAATPIDAPVDDRPDLVGIPPGPLRELERDYRPQFDAIGITFNVWSNDRKIAAEVNPTNERIGRLWGASADFARRARPLGRPRQFRTLDQAIADVRRQLDELLLERPWEKTDRWKRSHRR